MKVSELKGALLDYWVAKANCVCPSNWTFGEYEEFIRFSPATDWSQGGPIIEREGIELKKDLRHLNIARIAGFEPDLTMPGRTPLIAAMRAFVASKYGESVPCPDPE